VKIEFHNVFYFLFLESDARNFRATISNTAFKNLCKAYSMYCIILEMK